MPSLRLKDLELHYALHGPASGAGAPLLFIHGLGSCAEDWDAQREAFAADHRLIVPDLRGHGASGDSPGPYSIAVFAADMQALLEHLGCGPAHVVGLSLGGAIAFQLALDAPQLVRTLTIVNSGPELILRTFKEKFAIGARIAMVRALGLPRFAPVLAKRLFPRPEQAHLRATFIARYLRNRKAPYLASLRALVGWSVAARLGEIRAPTLIVSADEDYTPVSLKREYAAKLADARVAVVADSRHATPIDQPAAFNQVLAEFLAPR